MRLLTWAGIGVLSLTLGISAARAQDEPKREDPKPEQNDARPQQAPADQDKQEMKQDQNQAPKEDKQTKEEKQQQKDDAKAAKNSSKQDQMNRAPANNEQMNRAQENQGQMNHAQPANGKSGHIPDKDFKAHFGRQHTVVINQPVIVEGQPRFQSGGYWFVISDPWPAGWAYTDQCYIDYVDGEYFLFDLLHPGVRIALFVVAS